jgi:short-subunit dehydrogenase involved in D-alanine esterification of teichoic acids
VRGNRIIISGRRVEALAAAKRDMPALETPQCDVSNEGGRAALAEEAERHRA